MNKLALMLAVLILAAAPSFAADVVLTACASSATFGGNPAVPMWGFVSGNVATCPATWAPGPPIEIPVADSVLNVTLHNRLSVPTSIFIPGLNAPSAPVFFNDAQGRRRVKSLVAETPPGASGFYTFNAAKPGTYLYHSGTHMQVQVQMGLYGAVTKDAAANTAYTAVPYAGEVVLLYSEVDPGLHAAVAGGTYGTGAYTSTYNYKPRYFLVNGKSFAPADPPLAAFQPNTPVLVRFVNAALDQHMPALSKGYLNVVAEDGNLYPAPKTQYAVSLPPLKTLDALWVPAPGDYVVYDRALGLSTNGAVGGGMYARLRGEAASAVPVATDDTYTVAEDVILTVPAPGVLANDTGATLSAILVTNVTHGSLTLSASGSFTYTPAANYNGPDQFTYKANNGTADSNVATARITVTPVADAPVAVDDTATTQVGAAININVLSNDTDAEGNVLSVVQPVSATGGTATINPDKTIAYTPPSTAGTYTITYTVSDGALTDTGVVTVTVTTGPNRPPVAVNDIASTSAGATININVLVNDTDPDGNPLTVVTPVSATGGTATINNNQIRYTAPSTAGTYSITYTVSDGAATDTGQVTVTVTTAVTNPPPVAVDDIATAPLYPGEILIPVLANDYDPNGTLAASTLKILQKGGKADLGVVRISATDYRIRYRAKAGQSGADWFTYSVRDNQGATSNAAKVSVTIQ